MVGRLVLPPFFHIVYGAITTHELCPPNPKELEIAAATQQGKKQGENEIFGDLKKIKNLGGVR